MRAGKPSVVGNRVDAVNQQDDGVDDKQYSDSPAAMMKVPNGDKSKAAGCGSLDHQAKIP